MECVEFFGGAVVDGVDLIEDEGESSRKIGSWIGNLGGVRRESGEGAGWDFVKERGPSERETTVVADENRH